MKMISLFIFINSCLSGYWETYKHPTPESLYTSLSESVNKETQENFIIINMGKYEFRKMKEVMSNNSIKTKKRILEKKMNHRRKIDRLFARHASMIRGNHKKATENLEKLELIRSETSNHLYNLKKDHEETQMRLKKNSELINNIFTEKKNHHMEKVEGNYKKWKENHEEAGDIINGL